MKQKNKQENKTKVSTRKKKTYTYAEAHNRAFWAFNKASKIMVWAAVFNVIGLMIAIIQANFGTILQPPNFRDGSYYFSTIVHSAYKYPLCFAISSMIFRFLELPAPGQLSGMGLPFFAFIVIAVVIAIIMSCLVVWVSVQASIGKKWALYGQASFYLIDTGLIIALHLMGEYGDVIWIMFGVHMLIMFFIGVSIYQYYKILTIEKVYKNSLTNSPEAYENKNKPKFSMMNPTNSKKINKEFVDKKQPTNINQQENEGENENGTRNIKK